MTDPGVRLRADARRNRDQILAAARTEFAESGPDVPMEEIARQAGVGVGTLYRRFPDRQALIRAVTQDNFAEVLAETKAAVAEEPTAWDALVRVVRQSRNLQLSVQLMILSPQASVTILDDPMTGEFRAELFGTLETLIHRAQAEGTLRDDIGTGDIATLLSLLLRRSPVNARSVDWVAAERALILMLDGLRARPGSPLPGTPQRAEDLTPLRPEDLNPH